MPSDLVAAALKQAALRAFSATPFGKLVRDLSKLGSGLTSLSKLSGQSSSLRSRSGLNVPPQTLGLAAKVRMQIGSKLSGTIQRQLYALTGLTPVMNIVAQVQKYAKGAGAGGSRKQRQLKKVIKALSKGKSGTNDVDIQRQLQAAADLLRAFGYNVTPPTHTQVHTVPNPNVQPKRSRQRKTLDLDLGDLKKKRIKLTDPILSGEMIPVQSSNVYAIGFVLDEDDYKGGKHGTLLIQFLAQGPNGTRQGPGSTYQYFGVPAQLFQKFRKASSKGRFVWDNIRVRGTVSQSRFTYELAGITQGYVPRRAAHRQGVGEFFNRRQFQGIKSMNTIQVNSNKRLKSYKPYKPTLNRGTPNRGKKP